MATVRLARVGKSFGAVTVLKDIDLAIADKEFVVFVGPSGCGKSTLLRMIAGLEDVTSGTIEIDGEVVNDVPPAQREIAMVFQSYALYPHKTVRENMGFGLRMANTDKATIERKVFDAAQVLGLEALLDRRPKELSGGQRQRVAIGRAIVRKPRLFLFDEPLSNLDASLRGQMRIEIARLHQTLNATMIFVTHDQVEAMTLANKIVVLNSGRVEQVGAPLELYERPVNLFVAGFIGSPKMNLLQAEISSIDAGGATVRLNCGAAFAYPLSDSHNLRATDKVTVGVRPQHLSDAQRPLTLEAGVLVVERLGAETHALLQLTNGETVMACLGGRAAVQVGERLRVGADIADCHVFDAAGVAVETPARLRPEGSAVSPAP